jgi:magnesium chelatase family protein
VCAARELQTRRFAGHEWLTNAELPHSGLPEHCRLEPAARALLERSVGALGLTMRALVRSLRVARTLADLEARETLSAANVAEALSYRAFDQAP